MPVLVKFSPPVRDATSRRIADLLIAEHLCLQGLRAHGHPAAPSVLIRGGERVFLEVERFDRVPPHGRRGLISLFALDAEFVGEMQGWSKSVASLAAQGRVAPDSVIEARWRELFGSLLANTDMHPGNLSFFMRGTRVLSLAPTYDMAPALYAPTQGHVREPPFSPPIPTPHDAPLWADACTTAVEVWGAIAAHKEISAGFRKIAAANRAAVLAVSDLARLLPRRG